MWRNAKRSPSGGASGVLDPRLARLQRAKRRKLTLSCILEASLDWIFSLASPSGVAYLVSLLCLITQTICIDAFLVTYMSSAVLLTLAVEIPLLGHLAVYWREESAHRSAPSEWLAYSWVHAAKVVVLFCRVMPRLPTSSDVLEEAGDSSHYSFFGINLDQLFTPTMLANLLLITPVFYALLMFRTSKAIFGKITHRITVDLILHYDMLWHVVIDMVDQVDMFHYARLPEVESTAWLAGQKEALVRIQTVIPVFLFLSMVLQAQAFPGVVVDRWKLPERAPSKERGGQNPVASSELSHRPTWPSEFSTASRLRRPMATLRERSFSSHEAPGSEAVRAPSTSPRSEPMAPPPPPAPACLQPCGLLAGPPLPPPGHGQAAPAAHSQSPGSPLAALAESQDACPPLPEANLRDTVSTEHTFLEFQHECSVGLESSGSERPSRRSRLSEPLPVRRSSLSRRMHMSPTRSLQAQSHIWSRRAVQSGGGEVMSREKYLRLEKDRRRRLLDIINAIHRQNIIIARKRSAMISIFFTDIPFLTIRMWLWILLGNKYFPGLGVKNAICIILNGMQATLVRFADRAAFRDIQAQMVQYRVRFVGSGFAAGSQGSPDCEHLASPGADATGPGPLTPSDTANSAFSTPQTMPAEENRGRPMAASLYWNWKQTFTDAERTVHRETVRSTGVCVHFWSMLLAFAAGFILAKGEHFIATFIAWVQNRDPNAPAT